MWNQLQRSGDQHEGRDFWIRCSRNEGLKEVSTEDRQPPSATWARGAERSLRASSRCSHRQQHHGRKTHSRNHKVSDLTTWQGNSCEAELLGRIMKLKAVIPKQMQHAQIEHFSEPGSLVAGSSVVATAVEPSNKVVNNA
jgi:hypothetical protein